MNQKLTINKEYWLERNPDIEFHRVKKAYYGTHLLRANVYICGASMRYYQHGTKPNNRIKNPTYEEFMLFLRKHVMQFNVQKLIKVIDNRFIHCTRKKIDVYGRKDESVSVLRVYDAKILYALYNMIKVKPDGIRLSREYDSLRVYSNDIDDLRDTLDELGIPSKDIKSITSPAENDVALLLAGKEFNNKADKFKYKVFLKSVTKEGIPNLAKYLESIEDTDEVELPRHCRLAINGPRDRWAWAYSQRSYLYVKDEDTILIIQILTGDRYSNCVELILPSEKIDK